MEYARNLKRCAYGLGTTIGAPAPSPPLLQARSFDMDRGVPSEKARIIAAGRAAEAAARAENARRAKARRHAARLTGSDTSASGGGGGGVSSNDALLNT